MAYKFEPPYPAEHLKIDLFPSRTERKSPEQELLGEELRVIVTDSHLYVFRDGSEAPDNFILKEITSFDGSPSSGWTIATSDEEVYHISRNPTCGCGSRLRGFHPFPGVPFIRLK